MTESLCLPPAYQDSFVGYVGGINPYVISMNPNSNYDWLTIGETNGDLDNQHHQLV